MSAVNQTWHKIKTMPLRGTWRPGSYNVVLLIAQVVILWTAAQRGLDYLNLPNADVAVPEPGVAPSLHGIEADVSLRVLGLAFLVPALVAFVGLTTGWARMLSLGHLVIGASYLILGITFLRDSPVANWPLASAGCALLIMAAALLVGDSRTIPDVFAITGGVIGLVVGGWLASKGLGYGYRTGNGFLGGAALHFTFGFGTQVLARREERLRREEEEDFKALGLS
jgi:hypothetical protein